MDTFIKWIKRTKPDVHLKIRKLPIENNGDNVIQIYYEVIEPDLYNNEGVIISLNLSKISHIVLLCKRNGKPYIVDKHVEKKGTPISIFTLDKYYKSKIQNKGEFIFTTFSIIEDHNDINFATIPFELGGDNLKDIKIPDATTGDDNQLMRSLSHSLSDYGRFSEELSEDEMNISP